MLKIVVFDGGWGGELVANFLDREINVVEVVRVIDWAHGSYCDKTSEEVFELADRCLEEYIGRCDVIVLGGFWVGKVRTRLEHKYSQQKFIGVEIDYTRLDKLLKAKSKIAVLAGNRIIEENIKEYLENSLLDEQICCVDCGDWESLVDENRMSSRILAGRLSRSGLAVVSLGDLEGRDKSEMMPIGVRIKLERAQFMPEEDKYALAKAVRKFEHVSDEIRTVEKRVLQVQLERTAARTGSRGERVEAVVLADTHFWDLTGDLEKLLGWNTRIFDFRQKLLRDVCVALGLQGLDGNRSKY